MKKVQISLLATLLMLFSAVIFTGCNNDDDTPTITGEALFSYTTDGLTVTFKNESTVTPPVTYLWDFGDGNTSTEKDPVHTYASKGEYTVKLIVTDQLNGKHEVQTKISVDRKTKVTFNDGSLDDWNDVTGDQFVVPLGDNSGAVVAAKYEYDAEYVYAYYEFEGNISETYQFDLFLDFDNSATTGFTSYLWPASGADYLVEIPEFTADTVQPYAFNYTGAPGQEDWNWEEKQLPDGSIQFGTMVQKGNNVAFEVALKRETVGNGLLQNDVIALGAFISNADWAEIGYAPDATQDGEEPQGYFVFNMN